MSFSNNSSRTILNDKAYGTNLTLTETLRVPTIYLNGTNLSTTLSNLSSSITSTPSTLASTCTGDNLVLSSVLTCKTIEIGPTVSATKKTYLDLKTYGGNSDYDARMLVTGGSSTTTGQGALELNAASCSINSPLTVASITNSGSLTTAGMINTDTFTQSGIASFTGGVEVGPYSGSLTYIDMKTLNGASDYDVRLGVTGSGGNLKGQGSLDISAANCAINAPLTTGIISTSGIVNSGTLTQTDTASFMKPILCTSLEVGDNDTDGYSYIDMKNKNSNTDFGIRFECTTDAADIVAGLDTLTVISNKNNFSGATNILNTLSCYRIEVGTDTPDAFSYIDMKTHGTHTDYDVRFGCAGGSSVTAGQGNLTINSSSNTFSGLSDFQNGVSTTFLKINGTSLNTYLGYQSGLVNTSGFNNSCLGYQAGKSITSGSYNTCVGYNTGSNITSGEYNTCLGYQAGTYTSSGTNVSPTAGIYIGSLTKPSLSALNEIVIGSDVAGNGSNTITIGNSMNTSTILNSSTVYCSNLSIDGSVDVGTDFVCSNGTATIATANISNLNVSGNLVFTEIKTPIINNSVYLSYRGISYQTGVSITNYLDVSVFGSYATLFLIIVFPLKLLIRIFQILLIINFKD
jgi:hypothetical protein